jgi:hypothetical protein
MRLSLMLLTALLAAASTRPARASLPASLLEKLATPLMQRTFTTLPEGRLVLERLMGGEFARSMTYDNWRVLTEQAVGHGSQNPQFLDEVYLRVLRLEHRLRVEAEPGSALVTGAGRLTAGDFVLLQRIGSEELALRSATWVEKIGLSQKTPGHVQFSKLRRSAANFEGERQLFLSGGGRKAPPALERSLTVLNNLAERREMTYLLFQTDEGKALLHAVLGPDARALYGTGGAKEAIARIAALPEARDVVLQLALRLDQAAATYDAFRVKLAFGDRGEMRQRVLKRIAHDYLALSPATVPGALNFAPVPLRPMEGFHHPPTVLARPPR